MLRILPFPTYRSAVTPQRNGEETAIPGGETRLRLNGVGGAEYLEEEDEPRNVLLTTIKFKRAKPVNTLVRINEEDFKYADGLTPFENKCGADESILRLLRFAVLLIRAKNNNPELNLNDARGVPEHLKAFVRDLSTLADRPRGICMQTNAECYFVAAINACVLAKQASLIQIEDDVSRVCAALGFEPGGGARALRRNKPVLTWRIVNKTKIRDGIDQELVLEESAKQQITQKITTDSDRVVLKSEEWGTLGIKDSVSMVHYIKVSDTQIVKPILTEIPKELLHSFDKCFSKYIGHSLFRSSNYGDARCVLEAWKNNALIKAAQSVVFKSYRETAIDTDASDTDQTVAQKIVRILTSNFPGEFVGTLGITPQFECDAYGEAWTKIDSIPTTGRNIETHREFADDKLRIQTLKTNLKQLSKDECSYTFRDEESMDRAFEQGDYIEIGDKVWAAAKTTFSMAHDVAMHWIPTKNQLVIWDSAIGNKTRLHDLFALKKEFTDRERKHLLRHTHLYIDASAWYRKESGPSGDVDGQHSSPSGDDKGQSSSSSEGVNALEKQLERSLTFNGTATLTRRHPR